MPFTKHLVTMGRKKLPFNTKKPVAEPGSGSISHLPQQVWG